MRMPRFNMSPDEATKLVNYFAARDNVEFPYSFSERRRSDRVEAADKAYRDLLKALHAAGENETEEQGEEDPPVGARFRDAMKIVTNPNYCVQCHPVGDFDPDKELRGKGPDLARIYQRLRPDYLRNWLAKPTSFLPYTGMPVNIAYDPNLPHTGSQVPQDLFHGASIQQLDALVDLLMNYDLYARQRSPITPLVQQQQLREEQEEEAAQIGDAPDAEDVATGSDEPVEETEDVTEDSGRRDSETGQAEEDAAAASGDSQGNGESNGDLSVGEVEDVQSEEG
jgi:hypothetical protein